ncbi:MAG: bifunctional 4-hydroxy-2-oxoglutarate aldolase/2-dehydro-3-deoxy-phosphogluconate aldolase [Rhodospirillales bacterium]
MTILELMRTGPVIPVIVIDRIEDAVPLARALVAGGVRVLEVTLRTPVALEAVARIGAEVEGAIVGVGTITRSEDIADALAAGARFGVSPGLSAELVEAARASALPLLPGVMTPSDVIAAGAAGFRELKLFPAKQAGGVAMLKALAGPFPEVMFCPTGGITVETAPEYLALPNVACVGGSWLMPRDAIERGDWETISRRAKEAAALRA